MSASSFPGAFVGRADDLTRIRALIAAGERVVTIVGPPGIGKTRLAREIMCAREGGPTAFCSLADARDADAIYRAVASGLGVSLAATGSPVAQLARVLTERGTSLLVLDNAEQVREPTRHAVTMWRDFAPGSAFLVTSRERLGLEGEVVHELSRFTRPEALELLVDRVARAGRKYAAGDVDISVLARIAERLDGLPLAIEIVAPRVALLGARTVDERLGARGELLPTLRATLEWSWALLNEDEQRALARCSVFEGDFAASAAAEVLGAGALDLLRGLRQKSLLVVSPPPLERFGLAFSVRDFAAEKLDALGLREESERAHARWFSRWALRAEDDAPRPEAARELAEERQNLVAAAERAIASATRTRGAGARGAADLPALAAGALSCAAALHALAWTTEPFDAYEPLLSRAIELADEAAVSSPELLWALASRGQARRRLGRREEARADLDRAIALAPRLADRRGEGRALGFLGLLEIEARCLDAARAALDRSLQIARSVGDRGGEAHALYALGLLATERGDASEASVLFERAVRLFERTGAVGMRGYARMHLSASLMHRGILDEAARMLDDAIADHREVGNTWIEGLATCNRGAIELARGTPGPAAATLDRGLELLRATGDDRSYGAYLAHRALALSSLGRPREARSEIAHASDLLRRSCDVRSTALVLGWFAGILAENGDVDAAERTLAEAAQLVEGLDVSSARCVLDAERVQIDAARARRAREAGGDVPAEVARAQARLAAAEEATAASLFYTARLSIERARAALASLEPAAPLSAPKGPTAEIVVDAGGRWVIAGGKKRSIARKITLQRLLRRLVEARRDAPGEPVSSGELVNYGWPDERVDHEAALNRLRVAVARLRQLGLERAIVGLRGGYLLDPEAPVAIDARARDAHGNDS